MKKILLFVLLQFCLLITVKSQIKWDEKFTPFISELASTDPYCNDNSDLLVFSYLFKEKKIVALGEATHGTKEFFTTKHRLIRYLVEKHDFRVFVIEDGYTLTHNVNSFVAGTNDISAEKVLSRNWIGAWRTQEVLNMLLWIKSFNDGKSDNDKVMVYGCDMKWYRTPAMYIRSELKKSNKIDGDIEKTLKYLINHSSRDKMTKNKKKEVKLLISRLNKIGSNTSNSQLKFNIRVLEQCMDYIWSNNVITSISSIKRDKYMAENCMRIYEQEGHKMIIWGHNQHIAEHSDYSRLKPMGAHLKEHFGNEYYTIGFGFYSGEYHAYDPEKKKSCACVAGIPKSNCIDHTFATAPYQNFFFNLKNEELPDQLAELVNKTSWSRRAGALYDKDPNSNRNYSKRKLAESYDALIFIRNSSSVKPLPYTP